MAKSIHKQRADLSGSGVRVLRFHPGSPGLQAHGSDLATDVSERSFGRMISSGTDRIDQTYTRLAETIQQRDDNELSSQIVELGSSIADREHNLLNRVAGFERFLLELHRPDLMGVSPADFSLRDVMVHTERFIKRNVDSDAVVIGLFEDSAEPDGEGEVVVGGMFYDTSLLTSRQRNVLGGNIKTSTPHMRLLFGDGCFTVDDMGLASKSGFISPGMKKAFPGINRVHVQALGREGLITCLRSGEPFSDDDIVLMGAVAGHVSGLIRDYKRMERDPFLGQLYSKGQSKELVSETLEHALRRGPGEGEMCMVAWDIDHFRKVNEHGHAVGDVVLGEVANLMVSSVRRGDKVIRAGGEELWTLMPHCGRDVALERADRIRKKVAASVFGDSSSPDNKGVGVDGGLQITISGGVAEFRVNEDGLAVLDGEVIPQFGNVSEAVRSESGRSEIIPSLYNVVTARADEAEINSKQTGRNRISYWDGGSYKRYKSRRG